LRQPIHWQPDGLVPALRPGSCRGGRMNDQAPGPDQVTQMLDEWRDGSSAARDRVINVVYEQIRQLAARHLRRQYGSGAVTMQPTELANELFIRLLDSQAGWEDRRHFYNAAAVAMQRILVDAARARGSEKRGGNLVQLTLSAADSLPIEGGDAELLEDALGALRSIDPRKCEIIVMT